MPADGTNSLPRNRIEEANHDDFVCERAVDPPCAGHRAHRKVETVLAPGFPGSLLEAPVSTAVRNVVDNADVVDLPMSVVP